jgi:DNA-binding NarL/FixJ family response regulator
MKSKKQNTAVNEAIVLTPELMKIPGIKQFLKQVEAVKEKSEMENTLAPVVAAANNALGQKFETFAQMVKYVSKKTGEKTIPGSRGLTDEQKVKVLAMDRDKKRPKEIAEELNCKPTLVSAYIFNSKKKN